MNNTIYTRIPTWNNGTWEYKEFSTKQEFRDYIKGLFKEPGKYEFDETTLEWNKNARKFQKDKLFCVAPEGSRDFQEFWDTEKEKCKKGVIYLKNGKEWYLPRQYYMWMNYLPIYDKVKGKLDFPRVWDSQYHVFLYELLAQLSSKHAAETKKRQWGNTYMKMARQICRFWFDEGYTGRIGASLKDYINEKGAWKFLNQYRDFLNRHTAWYRGLDPEKTFSWQQRIRIREAGRDSYEGLKSSISGTSFEKDPTAGVGGNTDEFYHEEAGIAPKLHMTYEFMRPAMSAGGIATGLFIAAGSVGDLDQCHPLRNFMEYPDDNGFLGVETNLIDEHGTTGIRGLFVPEQWSYEVEGDKEPCIDKWGNSLVDRALQYIAEERAEWKRTLSAEMYQLRISQKPINIKEAFDIRKSSLFPVQYTGPQTRRIENNEYALEYVDLIRDKDNTIKTVASDRVPCEFPTDMRNPDKRGVVVIHERPIEGAKPLVTYIGSVDPVSKGIAQHSDSLACVYIYKMPVEVLKKHSDGTTDTFMEGGKLVAWWTGRYDDVNETNEEISKLVEYYQAYTTVEYNVGSFVNYMIGKRRQKYLALKDDMIFDAELGIKQGVSIPYGWYKTQSVWGKLLEYAIDSLSTVTSQIEDGDGNIKEVHYGVERIPDIWLLKEMDQYDPKSGNYDRIVAYAALMAFADLRSTLLSGLYKKQEKVIREQDKLEETDFMPTFKAKQGPFRNLISERTTDIFGNRQQSPTTWKRRSPFRNL